jgi:hypothetical protein
MNLDPLTALVLIVLSLVIVAAALLLTYRLRPPLQPPVQPPQPTPAPALPRVDAERTCATCRHFDLEAGQALMRQQHVFAAMVAPFVSPSEYHEVVDKNDEVQKTNVSPKCAWNRFGMCTKHNEGFWERMTAQDRLNNCKDLTTGGDCYEEKS